MLLFAMIFATSAKATSYISDVILLGNTDGNAIDALVSQYENQGWTKISRDLNDGAGGDYIYLMYKKQSTNGQNYDFITDFYIKTGSSAPEQLTYNGRTYYRTPCDGRQHFKNQHGDLNSGTGESTESIHLYYTRDYFSNNQVVTDIDFSITQKSGAVGANGGSSGYDLNDGAGGLYIYMHVTWGTAKPELLGSGTPDDAYQINNDNDWKLLVKYANEDKTTEKFFYQGGTITVKEPVGSKDHPFRGCYYGDNQLMKVDITSDKDGAAPFCYVQNALIKNLNVTGQVSYVGNNNAHASGLVGICQEANYVLNCNVSTNVQGGGKYCGGIVGHGGAKKLTIENCVYDGILSGYKVAAGLMGWSDGIKLYMYNCLMAGNLINGESGKCHPIACTYAVTPATGKAFETYYLNTIVPNCDAGNIVAGAKGRPVSATSVENSWDEYLLAVNGKGYYGAHNDGPKQLPYSFGFEQIPCGWSMVNAYNQGGVVSGLAATNYCNGKYGLMFATSSMDQYLISPELKCYEKAHIYLDYFTDNQTATMQIGISTTTKDLDAFQWSNPFTAKADYLTTCEYKPTGKIKYVAIKCVAGSAPLYLDNFYIEDEGLCTPFDLNVSDITDTSAQLQWDGNADSYNIRYRPYSFKATFEDGATGWSGYVGGGNEYTTWTIRNWTQLTGNRWHGHSGNMVAIAGSVDWSKQPVVPYNVDTWLITPQIPLGKTLTYWMFEQGEVRDYYEVLVSTTTKDQNAFQKVADSDYGDPAYYASGTWQPITVDLSEYQGQTGWIAFRLKDEGKNYMVIDDIAITDHDWTTITVSDLSQALSNLAPGTVYDVQVQGVKGGDTSPWSDVISFTTLGGGGGDPNGIRIITHERTTLGGAWFDLLGRKQADKPSKPGLYINNGKKIYMK